MEACRQKGVSLEDELPERITSEEERELLGLLCRVHELEADKVSLQAERLARQGELRRRDLQLLRAERQRRLCEDIISTQRKIIEGINGVRFLDETSFSKFYFAQTKSWNYPEN